MSTVTERLGELLEALYAWADRPQHATATVKEAITALYQQEPSSASVRTGSKLEDLLSWLETPMQGRNDGDGRRFIAAVKAALAAPQKPPMEAMATDEGLKLLETAALALEAATPDDCCGIGDNGVTQWPIKDEIASTIRKYLASHSMNIERLASQQEKK